MAAPTAYKPKGQPLIILGMHRSGTSFLASYLKAGGLKLGDDLLGAGVGNPRGHFESRAILDFHIELLNHALPGYGEQFGRYASLVKKTPKIRRSKTLSARAADVLRQIENDGLWGWKEPRTALFLDLWLDLLPNAHLVAIYRHPLEVHDSLMRRGGEPEMRFSESRSLDAYTTYNREIIRALKHHKGKSVVLSAAGSFSDIPAMKKAIESSLGITLGRGASARQFASNEFATLKIPPQLDDLLATSHPPAADTYQELQSLAALPRTQAEKPSAKLAAACAGSAEIFAAYPKLHPDTRLRILAELATASRGKTYSKTLANVLADGEKRARAETETKAWADREHEARLKAESWAKKEQKKTLAAQKEAEEARANTAQAEKWAAKERALALKNQKWAESIEAEVAKSAAWAKNEEKFAKEARAQAEKNKEWAEREMANVQDAQQQAEEARAQAEKNREWAEREMANVQDAQQQAEEARAQAEKNQEWAEREMANVQDAQQQAEEARAQAEKNKEWAQREMANVQDAQQQAEEARAQAEKNREWAEREMANVQDALQQAEEARAQAEKNREWAEREMANVQDALQQAEEARAQAEKNREWAQREMANVQDAQQQAEEARALAEENREWAERERDGRTAAEKWGEEEGARAQAAENERNALSTKLGHLEGDLAAEQQRLHTTREKLQHQLDNNDGLIRQLKTAEEELALSNNRIASLQQRWPVRILRALRIIKDD